MKRRLCTISLAAALVVTACTGGDGAEQAAQQVIPDADEQSNVARSVGTPSETTTPPAEQSPEPAVDTTTAPQVPNSLAFASADDVGRLFSVNLDIITATNAGGEPDGTTVAEGTIIQASSLTTEDDVLWVRIESTAPGGGTIGWLPSNVLSPTTQAIEITDPAFAREFRQVASVVEGDQLPILPNPGSGTPTGFLAESEIALHGGTSAIDPDGARWLDVLEPESGTRVGWVLARSLGTLGNGVIQNESGTRAASSPLDGVSYGQSVVGGISATGCNAVQITLANPSASAGLGVVLGTTSPIGRELGANRFQWSGTSVFSEAGSDLTITIPNGGQTWFFASLNSEGQAEFSTFNEDGRAVASNVQEIAVPGSACVREEPVNLSNIYDPATPAELAAAAAIDEAAEGEGDPEDGPDSDAPAEGEGDPEDGADSDAPAEGADAAATTETEGAEDGGAAATTETEGAEGADAAATTETEDGS